MLIIHLLLHFLFSLLVGIFLYKKFEHRNTAILGAFIGGVFVDLDHLIDYILAFGWHFNLVYFLKGYEFLQSDKIYIFLHAWEWVLLLFIAYYLLRIKKIIKPRKKLMIFILAVACSLTFHLLIDTYLDATTTRAYFISYRIKNHFDLKSLVSPKHWLKHQKMKRNLPFVVIY